MRTHRTGRYAADQYRANHPMPQPSPNGNRYDDGIAGVASAARGG
jgi:hypothetical protein